MKTFFTVVITIIAVLIAIVVAVFAVVWIITRKLMGAISTDEMVAKSADMKDQAVALYQATMAKVGAKDPVQEAVAQRWQARQK